MSNEHSITVSAISPFLEMGSYEWLWSKFKSFSKLSDFLKKELIDGGEKTGNLDHRLGKRISDLVEDEAEVQRLAQTTLEILHRSGIDRFGVRVAGEGEFPAKILDAEHPSFCLYYQGFWNFTESQCISVVGTRKPTEKGIRRTRKLVRQLAKDDYTIVSGLASGIDTVAHETALDAGGATIAVMGTPLNKQYPSENKKLREKLAKDYLVLTQFPVGAKTQPFFFTERNKIMSAITEATIIVEAGKSSGTMTQARAALHQGRKLFILDNCFERSDLTWPKRFEELGAIRVREYQDIKESLKESSNS